MLRDGKYLREPKPAIGRAYQPDARYKSMTDGMLIIQRSSIRDYARRDTFWGQKEDNPVAIAILAILAPLAVLVLLFLPEMMR